MTNRIRLLVSVGIALLVGCSSTDDVATSDAMTTDAATSDTTSVDTAIDSATSEVSEDSELETATDTPAEEAPATDSGSADAPEMDAFDAGCPTPAIAENTLRYGPDSTSLTGDVHASGYWSLHGTSAARNVAAYFQARPAPGVYLVVGSLPTSASNVGLSLTFATSGGIKTLDPVPFGCVNVVAGSDGKLEISFAKVLFSTTDSSESNYADARVREP